MRVVWNQMERKVQKHPHIFRYILLYLCTTGVTWGKPAWVTEYASDGASAEVCCRNHSVPHLSEYICEVLNDVEASNPTATCSRHGHDGSMSSHLPVDEIFPSSPGWCRPCVLRRCHPWVQNLGRRTWQNNMTEQHDRTTWHILEYCSAIRTPEPPEECGGSIEEYYSGTIYILYKDSMIQSLKSRFGELIL